MLILSRREGESLLLTGGIRVTLVRVKSRYSAQIGVDAPQTVKVFREELCDSTHSIWGEFPIGRDD